MLKTLILNRANQGSSEQGDLIAHIEAAFGGSLARDIEAAFADMRDGTAMSFMAVKALSEILDAFRADAKLALRAYRRIRKNGQGAKIISLQDRRTRAVYRSALNRYRIAMGAFYQTYATTMASYAHVPVNPYRTAA